MEWCRPVRVSGNPDTTETITGKRRKRERRNYTGSRTDEVHKAQQAVRLHASIEIQCYWVTIFFARDEPSQLQSALL